MGHRDARIDEYIANSAEFAQPILSHLREVVHAACPGVEETMKWSAPYFMYHGMLCGFASFKQHCVFGFWKGELVLELGAAESAAGQFGRITSVKGLPSKKVLVGYVKRAMELNEAGVAAPRAKRAGSKAPLEPPPALAAALRRNSRARTAFEGMRPSHQREYIEWIAEAKREDTRARRVEQTIEMLEEGKSRHWQFQKN
jgi:uncharacterized protein YdeI (YjbR/CyaY-like superfamily)